MLQWRSAVAAPLTGLGSPNLPLTGLGSPTARSMCTLAAQASFDALNLALSSARVLCTFNSARCAELTLDASKSAVATLLTQPDGVEQQHPVA